MTGSGRVGLGMSRVGLDVSVVSAEDDAIAMIRVESRHGGAVIVYGWLMDALIRIEGFRLA